MGIHDEPHLRRGVANHAPLTPLSFLVRHFARVLTEAGADVALMARNRIVNLASILGLRTARNVVEYAAAKAGLVQLTHVLALELARHGIGVNALAPFISGPT